MLAAHTPFYGSPDVIELRDIPTPELGADQLRIEMAASMVSAGDRRLRSADFPGISAVPGRLMMGMTGPRNAVQGTTFAGRVVEVGADVTRFAAGDEVFGIAEHGAYAEQLVVTEASPVVRRPEGLSAIDAVTLPYGAGTAWSFLTDVLALRVGERLLVLGASGGVGRFAVQLGKHLGAHVTAVCSASQAATVQELGADRVIDYGRTDPLAGDARYDAILDIADATTFARARRVLTPEGRYATLFLSVGALAYAAWTALVGGPRAYVAVAMPSKELVQTLGELAQQGVVRPRIAAQVPLHEIARAHHLAETARGEVVVTMSTPPALRAVG